MNPTTGRRSRTLAWGGAFVVVAIVAAFAVVAATGRWDAVRNLPVRVATRWQPPRVEAQRDLSGPERRALRDLGGRLRGRIVWSSNRSGNHELYLATLDGDQPRVERLTDHPNVDFSSRFSPDGRQIVFARSQREWVSFREIDAWDLVLINADGSGQRKLAEHGYHPTWSRDGAAVVFQRGGQVVEIEVETGEERVLFDAATTLEGRGWGEQALHPDRSLLAMAVQRAGAIVMPLGATEFRHLTTSHVCQTTWIPGTRDLLWVEPEGNGGTRIVRGDAAGEATTVFMDLPGDRSHEYFPWMSDDGGWLVWAAASEGHEHDRADYEIYVWQVGTPWESATRTTFFSGNDQWPDVHIDG